jgi:hypothetical protein
LNISLINHEWLEGYSIAAKIKGVLTRSCLLKRSIRFRERRLPAIKMIAWKTSSVRQARL